MSAGSSCGDGARHGLAHHDGLHVGIAGKGDQLGNGGFLLSHELIRISIGDDVVGILLLEGFRGAELLLALRGGTGEDGDLPGAFFLGGSEAGESDQRNRQRQEHAKQFLHDNPPYKVFPISTGLPRQGLKKPEQM